ncbi:MAG: hypothetical protein U0Q16_21480 [Bryobacteraceae bacterium]
MGAKTSMLVIANGEARAALSCRPVLDREATAKLASGLFPDTRLEHIGSGDLSSYPSGSEVYLGSFPGVVIVSAIDFSGSYPSRLPGRFLTFAGEQTVYLHAMHSVVDWFAYAKWTGGMLTRSLSLCPDDGILEDIGQRLPFEEPFWAGHHPVPLDADEEEYPLPFHPLELGEAALGELFGYQLEGSNEVELFEPESSELMKFKPSAPWWKFW